MVASTALVTIRKWRNSFISMNYVPLDTRTFLGRAMGSVRVLVRTLIPLFEGIPQERIVVIPNVEDLDLTAADELIVHCCDIWVHLHPSFSPFEDYIDEEVVLERIVTRRKSVHMVERLWLLVGSVGCSCYNELCKTRRFWEL